MRQADWADLAVGWYYERSAGSAETALRLRIDPEVTGLVGARIVTHRKEVEVAGRQEEEGRLL